VPLTEYESSVAMKALLPLRQVCCDPRLGDGHSMRAAARQYAVQAQRQGVRRDDSLSGWFDRRQQQLLVAAEEALRSVVFESNALAAKLLLTPVLSPSQVERALAARQLMRSETPMLSPDIPSKLHRVIDLYKGLLARAEETETNGVRLDSFGRVHALHNLADVMRQLASHK